MAEPITGLESLKAKPANYLTHELPPELVELMAKLSMIVIFMNNAYYEIRLQTHGKRLRVELKLIAGEDLEKYSSKKCVIIDKTQDVWCKVLEGCGEIVAASLNDPMAKAFSQLMISAGKTGEISFSKRDRSDTEFVTYLSTTNEQSMNSHDRSSKELDQNSAQILSTANVVFQSEQRVFEGMNSNT